MSAMRAVSVMNCSCTATNRSSRARPRRTLVWFGATEAGLVQEVGAFEQPHVEAEDGVVVVEGAAAPILPRSRYRGDAGRRMHVGGAVAAAREAVAEPEIRPLPRADDMGEFLDVVGRQTGDVGRPFRRAGGEMRLELGRRVG